jgi:hypothetical protein
LLYLREGYYTGERKEGRKGAPESSPKAGRTRERTRKGQGSRKRKKE